MSTTSLPDFPPTVGHAAADSEPYADGLDRRNKKDIQGPLIAVRATAPAAAADVLSTLREPDRASTSTPRRGHRHPPVSPDVSRG